LANTCLSGIFRISYPKDHLFKNAVFASQKCRFRRSKTMFSAIKNTVFDRSPFPLPLAGEGAEEGDSLPVGAWIQVQPPYFFLTGAWNQVQSPYFFLTGGVDPSTSLNLLSEMASKKESCFPLRHSVSMPLINIFYRFLQFLT